jgi:hypothetical protein
MEEHILEKISTLLSRRVHAEAADDELSKVFQGILIELLDCRTKGDEVVFGLDFVKCCGRRVCPLTGLLMPELQDEAVQRKQ